MANPSIIHFLTIALLLTSMNGIGKSFAATAADAEYVPAGGVEYRRAGFSLAQGKEPYKKCLECRCCATKDQKDCKQMQCCYVLKCDPVKGTCSMAPASCNCTGCA